jgi:hypothetical protein
MGLTGCTTIRPVVTQQLPNERLSEVKTVSTKEGLSSTVTLPPGEYRAMFSDSSGVYYAPAGRIMVGGIPVKDATVLIEEGRAVALWIEGAKVTYWLKDPVVMK